MNVHQWLLPTIFLILTLTLSSKNPHSLSPYRFSKTKKTIYKLLQLLLIILVLMLLTNIYLFYPQIRQKLNKVNTRYPYNKIPSLLKKPLFIVLLIFCGLTIKNIIQCKRKQLSTIEKAKNKVIDITSQKSEIIESLLEKIAFVGQSIA